MDDDRKRQTVQPSAGYEPPRVEVLGTFAELTQMRTVPNVQDNPGQMGTR
jgi:hypothetical protein